ncbi:MAG: hypothetical protein CMG74_07825 [Candidatus Marinimicrobia bacterium]|nr:hypothetical protein [Candidatus Neomarinimicrobiota bacterium]
MNSLDWRLRLVGGLIIVIGGIILGLYANDLRTLGKDFNHYGVLSLICIWSGCDWILKSIA